MLILLMVYKSLGMILERQVIFYKTVWHLSLVVGHCERIHFLVAVILIINEKQKFLKIVVRVKMKNF